MTNERIVFNLVLLVDGKPITFTYTNIEQAALALKNLLAAEQSTVKTCNMMIQASPNAPSTKG